MNTISGRKRIKDDSEWQEKSARGTNEKRQKRGAGLLGLME